MKTEYKVIIEGQSHSVVVSDETEALLAAEAAGKASVGLWHRNQEQDLSMTGYVVESECALTQEYLERVVRRKLGLPWRIAETERLFIREFQMGDEKRIPQEPEDREGDRVFNTPQLLKEYIRCQYGFFEYGIWALVERQSKAIIGKAGVSQSLEAADGLELGYHIFRPYRRKGYGREACAAVLRWCRDETEGPVYTKIDASNEASIRLAESLGFRLINRRYSESGPIYDLYEWSC